MRTNSTQPSTWRQTLFVILALVLITGLAVLILGLMQDVTGQSLTNPPTTPAPLQPVQVQTAPTQTAPGTSSSFGQQVDDVVANLKKGANEASQTVQAEYAKARDAVQSLGIEARVYSRLHWDKDLANVSLNVSSPSPGIVALSGTLSDASAKTKAIRLAEDTVGVTKVLDQTTSTAP